jgi:TRAP-type C4-dicarboxylate transport system permease small subunit
MAQRGRIPSWLHWYNCALASVAGGMLGFIPLAIVVDVSMRASGAIPPQWTSAVVEYLNLYMPLLAAPWILEKRGHVVVGIFLATLPQPYRSVLDQAVLVVCLIISVVFGAVALQLLLEAIRSGAGDMRSITLPRWLLFAPVALAFFSFIPTLVCFLISKQSLREGESHSGH